MVIVNLAIWLYFFIKTAMDLVGWPRFFIEAMMSLAISIAVLTGRKIAVSFFVLFL